MRVCVWVIVSGLRFRVEGVWFRVWGSGLRVEG